MDNIKDYVKGSFAQILEDIKEMTLIPSPPFDESKKIGFIKTYLDKKGFKGSKIDKEGNLSLRIKGKSKSMILFSAHVDTVFPIDTRLEIKEDKERIYCPGICDNTAGIVSLIYLLGYIKKNGIKPKDDIIFLFNVGEEGLGNLRGIRYFIDHLDKGNLKAHIVIEGHQVGRMTTKAVGIYRARVKVKATGGHSWRDYGSPNAIIYASKAIDKISQKIYSGSPKTTFNVGTIKGGKSINSIPEECEFTFEIRSTSEQRIDEENDRINDSLSKIKEVRTSVEVLGERPAGEMKDPKLIALIRKVHQRLGLKTLYDAISTDANYPISLGLSSLTIGITYGEKTHSEGEFLYKEPIKKGLEQLIHIFEELDN